MSDNKQTNEWSERELGALWLKEGASSGKKFLTGEIAGQEVVVYKNDKYEEGGKMPYYRVYKSKPLDKDKPAEKKAEKAPDDIPFWGWG